MTDIREVQLCGKKILDIVVDICDRNNINYFLGSGTLIGAVRHEGFIPWDNDIDIEMPLKDYRKFLKIAKNELPTNCFLQTYTTDSEYNELWAKVRLNGTTSLPVAWKKSKMHFGIGIDIFPLIGIYQTPALRRVQSKLLSICRLLISKEFITATQDAPEYNYKTRVVYALPRTIRVIICGILELVVFRDFYASEKISMVFSSLDYYINEKAFFPPKRKKFEDKDYNVPNDWNYVLTEEYGDYMELPPIEDRNGHETALGSIIYDCYVDYREYTEGKYSIV